jgi:hypothetical protein
MKIKRDDSLGRALLSHHTMDGKISSGQITLLTIKEQYLVPE